MLIHETTHLFAKIKEVPEAEEVRQLLTVTASDFWHDHYTLNESSPYKPKKLGTLMIDNIMINTIVPALFAYAHYYNDEALKEKAIQWLSKVAAEVNTITAGFTQMNITNKTAFDSQAFIELKTGYCDKKKCLDCAIGNALLKKSAPLVML